MNDHPTGSLIAPARTHPDARVEIGGAGDGTDWTTVCRYGDLTPGRGVTALVSGEQVAVFRDEGGTLYALDNRDPVSGAYVISRGITGSLGGAPVVTSPMYKETYDLRTGARVDEDGGATAERLRTWPVRAVHPAAPPAPEPPPPPPALVPAAPARRGRTLTDWRPEDPAFWERTGARVARRNLLLSVLTEHIGFSVWSMWSVLVLFLGPEYGIDPAGKFTLTAVPTVVGGVLRLPYTYAVARFGGRAWTVFSSLLLLVPTLLMAAVLRPGVSFTTLLLVASVAGVGGGNFASSMANINAFYPGRLKGRALGVNAGVGNIGVPVVQLAGLLVLATAGAGHPVLLPLAYVPLIVLATLGALRWMDDLPAVRDARPALREIVRDGHTWGISLLYIGTFGSFIGFSFAFGLVLQTQFHDQFDTPVKVASLTFIGPLLGSLFRPYGGALADRLGGARVTLAVFAAMAASSALVLAAARAHWAAVFFAGFITLFVLSGLGNGSTYRMIPAVHGTRVRRATTLIGFAGAVGALGGVLVNVAFRQSFLSTGNGEWAYAGFLAFYGVCAAVTYGVYGRRRLG